MHGRLATHDLFSWNRKRGEVSARLVHIGLFWMNRSRSVRWILILPFAALLKRLKRWGGQFNQQLAPTALERMKRVTSVQERIMICQVTCPHPSSNTSPDEDISRKPAGCGIQACTQDALVSTWCRSMLRGWSVAAQWQEYGSDVAATYDNGVSCMTKISCATAYVLPKQDLPILFCVYLRPLRSVFISSGFSRSFNTHI